MKDTSEKIKSPKSLARTLGKLRGKKKRIVFTNGCFDLIHPGHVSYLEKARSLGDLLVVALDTDQAVRRLKGPGRPLNSLSDRMRVMAGLAAADYVTWFSGGNPKSLIVSLKPEVLVKGGDWKPDQIIGAKEVLSWGGQVRSLPYIRGRSTTAIVKRAKKAK